MSNTAKALVYVLLAMLEPLGKTLAVGAEKQAWPSEFEMAATLVAMIYAGLLVLKAWSSEPTKTHESLPKPASPGMGEANPKGTP